MKPVMADMENGLRTAEALKYADLDRTFWNTVVQRRLYTDLPELHPGRTGRFFDADDLIALDIFGELLRIGVQVQVSARIKGSLRACLRANPKARTLHLVTRKGEAVVVKTPPTDAVVQWTLDIAKARVLAQQAIVAAQWDTAMNQTEQEDLITIDQVISSFVQQHYACQFGPTLANRVASAFAEELEKGGEALRHLYVVLTAEGRPVRVVARKPADFIAHEFPVAEMRKNAVTHAESLREERS